MRSHGGDCSAQGQGERGGVFGYRLRFKVPTFKLYFGVSEISSRGTVNLTPSCSDEYLAVRFIIYLGYHGSG